MSLRSLLGAALLALAGLAQAAPLQLQVYNPGEAAVFPVSSTLISGEREATSRNCVLVACSPM